MRLVVLLICLALSGRSYAQTYQIGHLLDGVYRAQNSSEKLNRILALSDEYKSLDRDTLTKYAYQAQLLTRSQNDRRITAKSHLMMALMYSRWGWADSTLADINAGLRYCGQDNPDERTIRFQLLRQRALAFGSASRYREALDVLFQLIATAEKYHDTLAIAINLNTIGSVSLARDKAREAIPWLQRALSILPSASRFQPVRASVFINLAETYRQLSKPDSADYFIERGIALTRKENDLTTLAIALQRKSEICLKTGRIREAEEALKQMIAVRKKLGDASLWVDDNLALIHMYIESGQVEKAIQTCNAFLAQGDLQTTDGEGGKVLSNKIGIRLKYYEVLAACYKRTGNLALYEDALENIIAAKDSFYEANSAEAIATLQTQYDVQKKENTIIQQQFDLAKKDYLLYGSIVVGFLLFVIALVMFRNYRRRQQLRLAFMQREEKLLSEERVKAAQEDERRRISRDLHDNLGAYAASLGSNIDLLTRALPETAVQTPFRELRANSQAIVSLLNDTIWVLKKDAYSLEAIGDRIKLLIQRLQPSYPQVEIQCKEALDEDVRLPPVQAFHLFQIAGEGLNNALRHSGATAIDVALKAENGAWSLNVMDNGSGFEEPGSVAYEGNGLANMRARATECGWQIDWENAPTGGTRMTVSATN